MILNRSFFTLTVLLVGVCSAYYPASAQSIEERVSYAQSLDDRIAKPVFRDRIDIDWSEDEQFGWYSVETAPGRFEYVLIDTQAKQRIVLFDSQQMLGRINASLNSAHDNLPRLVLSFHEEMQSVNFDAFGSRWTWDRAHSTIRKENTSSETQHETMEYLRTWRRSRNGGASITVTFRNSLSAEIQLYWVTPTGDKVHYGSIPAQTERSQHTFDGHVWLIENQNGQPLAMYRAAQNATTAIIDDSVKPPRRFQVDREAERERQQSVSPDGRYSVSLVNFNVKLNDKQTEQEYEVTTEGAEQDGFEGAVWWSSDSRHFVVLRRQLGDRRKVHLVESSPKDQLEPKLHSIDYAKPGDRLDQFTPYVFDCEKRSSTKAESLPTNPQFSLEGLGWNPKGTEFRFQVNPRGHQAFYVLAISLDGQVRSIIEEKPDTFFCYSHKHYVDFLDDRKQLLWMSERDGFNHLYLIDEQTGEVVRQLTSGKWVVRKVDRVDTTRNQVWLTVSGIDPKQDPYFRHLVRVDLDSGKLSRLTHGNGDHEWTISPNGRWIVDRYSKVDSEPVTVLVNVETAEEVIELERGNVDLLRAAGWKPAEPFVAKGRDGLTDIYGVIVRPTNFDTNKKYPVLEYIYAGPQDSFVPKQFGRNHLLEQFAELGFIVVQIDGMGTSNRSKAFHDVCWKNLGDSGFPDRIAWINAAAKVYPSMDLSKGVGIWGGSAGGQSALRALLAHGDFYTAAAADCGCHDNRMDKIWWNEQWMGWPIDKHYEEQSNVTNASKLRGKLLLTVGELDKNVDPASTMQVAAALIKAEKDFDLIVFPGAGHGIGSSPYGIRKTMQFFLEAFYKE